MPSIKPITPLVEARMVPTPLPTTAPDPAQSVVALPTPVYTPAPTTTPSAASSEPTDWYKAWIYNEESGNNPTRWNSEGCLGLGQACPASKLLAVCPNEDYACEDNFFTQYMLQRYGSWLAAYEFHIANNWW